MGNGNNDGNNNAEQKKNSLLEKGKNKAKSAIAKKLIPILIQITIPVILILFAGALLFGIFNAVGDVVQDIIDGIVDFFTIDYEGAIEISDDQVDSIINGISGLGVSMDGLKLLGDVDYTNPDIQEENQKQLRKYIKKFYEAQAMTQTLNTNPNWLQEIGKTYGTVYVQRTKANDTNLSSTKQLTYIPYAEMKNKQEQGKTNIKDNFSINESGELVVSQTIKIEETGQETQTVIELKNINYKSVISQYTTSMNFFLYLTIISQNPEFVSAVVDLVKESDIKITLMDSVNVDVTEEVRTYTKNSVKVKDTSSPNATTRNYQVDESTKKEKTVTEKKKRTVTTTTPIPAVTYAKTWFCEQTIQYNKKETEKTPNTNSTEPINEEMPPAQSEGTVSWITNDVTTITTSGSSSTYEEGTRGDVIDKTGEKGDGRASFVGLLDVKFKIPNTTRYDSAGGNVVSGAEMLFYLLQKDSASQNLEQIMRYILYKYTGKDYGVTEIDFNIFQIGDFINISTNVLGNDVEGKVWYSLRNMGFSEYAVAGVMGNIYGESGFDPAIVERGNGIGFGLCQWSYGRRTQLEAYAASKGVSPSDVDTQVEFLMAELTPGGGANGYATYQLMTKTYYGETRTPNDWKNANNVADATKAFCYTFERPADPRAGLPTRISAAERYYNMFKGKTMSPSTGQRMTLQELFPTGIPISQAQMTQYLTSVEIVYNDKNGVMKTKNVTIHKSIAQEFKEIFSDIQKSGFKAYSIGTYNWRNISGSSKRSNHSYGLAVDINPTENYCVYPSGKVDAGSFWKPYENEYSITPDGAVVKAFKSRGWDWGGDWRSKKDYMHFSKNGG